MSEPPLERIYPEHAPTTPPPPGPRPTIAMPAAKRAELEAEMVKHEASRIAETLNRIDAVLPTLATKADLVVLDRGVSTAISEAQAAAAEVRRLSLDLRLWLFGDETRPGIAQGVEANNRLSKDALEVATRALRVAEGTYNAALHGPAAEEAKRGSGAPDLEVVGSGRPAR